MREPNADPAARLNQPIRWGRRIFVSIVLLLFTAIVAHAIWGWTAHRRLRGVVAALRAEGEWTVAADLTMPAVPDADNAALDLRAAAQSIDLQSEIGKAFYSIREMELPLNADDAAKVRAFVQANRPALDNAAKAWQKSGADWKIVPTTPTLLTSLPDLSPQRTLANLLQAAAFEAHERGDDAEALDRVSQIIRVGRALDDMRFGIITHLVGLGCVSLASHTLKQIAPDLRIASAASGTPAIPAHPATRAQVDRLLKELNDDALLEAGLVRGLRGERVEMLDATDALIAGKISPNLISGGASPSKATSSFTIYVIGPTVVNDTVLMTQSIGNALMASRAANWPTAQSRLVDLRSKISVHPFLHIWASILMSSNEKFMKTHYQGLTDAHLAALGLALRAYAVEHEGHLPATLDELVPAYLPAIPRDPMAAGGPPLRYVPRKDDPIIYSVGTNGTDEGGSDLPLRKTMVEPSPWQRQDVVFHLIPQPKPDADD